MLLAWQVRGWIDNRDTAPEVSHRIIHMDVKDDGTYEHIERKVGG
jgi:hypothetical protein